MIRIAAIGDVHYDRQPREAMRQQFSTVNEKADLLLLAGDLTQSGSVEEAKALIRDLSEVRIPVVTVLGNHDFHQDCSDEIIAALSNAGIIALEGQSTVIRVGNYTVGIMGMKGFGGGFSGACITEFGEPETKAFARHSREQADVLRDGLCALRTDFKIALTHYSPIDMTLLGEKKEIYPFLGSYLLGEAIDEARADASFHGHAHYGTERGITAGGTPVRNVALMVIRHAYKIYTFESPRVELTESRASSNA